MSSPARGLGPPPVQARPPAGTDDAPTAAARGRHAGEGAEGFGTVVTWTLLGSLVPGTGLLAAGRRGAGSFALGITGALVLGAGVVAAVDDPVALGRTALGRPDLLLAATVALAVLTAGWGLTVVLTHVVLRREAVLTGRQRAMGTVLVVALLAVATVPAVVAGNDALAARTALTSVFGHSTPLSGAHTPHAQARDPWAGVARENVLLMGGDSGADRTGVRPDTMILASIAPQTGDTVLISLPRNLQRVPFPEGSPARAAYPGGFSCYNAAAGANTECLLNALWQWGDEHPQYYPGDAHPGLTATVQGVEQVTGLPVDQYVMVNLRGFEQFVDILGGLEVNVTQRLPVGGSVEHPVASSWLEPGRQRLSGYLALWYARSRWSTTDYDRMRRQRCVIGDLVGQIDPVTVALRFSRVAATLQQNLTTSIPLTDLDAWVTLAQRVKHTPVRSLAFTDQVINTAHPDVARMHELVQQALVPPAARPATSPAASPAPSPGGSPSATPPASSSPAASSPDRAQDLTAVC